MMEERKLAFPEASEAPEAPEAPETLAVPQTALNEMAVPEAGMLPEEAAAPVFTDEGSAAPVNNTAVPEIPVEASPDNNGTGYIVQPVATAVPPRPIKKSNGKVLLIVLGSALVVALAVFLIVYFTIIKPNAIFEKAENALDRGEYSECERLMNQIPNHEDVPALRREMNLAMARSYIDNGNLDMAENLLATMLGDDEAAELRKDITYYRAEDLVKHGEYQEAQLLLDNIPGYDDSLQLQNKIDYETALSSLENGDYETAYEIFSRLGNYEDSAAQKKIVYYEALAFKSLFQIRDTLKNPSSMRITKVTFYEDSATEGELDAIFEFTATNSYGGTLGAYGYDLTLYNGEDGSGMISHNNYVDPDDYYDLLRILIIDAIKEEEIHDATVDVARMNRLLEGNASFKINLPFQNESIVES